MLFALLKPESDCIHDPYMGKQMTRGIGGSFRADGLEYGSTASTHTYAENAVFYQK